MMGCISADSRKGKGNTYREVMEERNLQKICA